MAPRIVLVCSLAVVACTACSSSSPPPRRPLSKSRSRRRPSSSRARAHADRSGRDRLARRARGRRLPRPSPTSSEPQPRRPRRRYGRVGAPAHHSVHGDDDDGVGGPRRCRVERRRRRPRAARAVEAGAELEDDAPAPPPSRGHCRRGIRRRGDDDVHRRASAQGERVHHDGPRDGEDAGTITVGSDGKMRKGVARRRRPPRRDHAVRGDVDSVREVRSVTEHGRPHLPPLTELAAEPADSFALAASGPARRTKAYGSPTRLAIARSRPVLP